MKTLPLRRDQNPAFGQRRQSCGRGRPTRQGCCHAENCQSQFYFMQFVHWLVFSKFNHYTTSIQSHGQSMLRFTWIFRDSWVIENLDGCGVTEVLPIL